MSKFMSIDEGNAAEDLMMEVEIPPRSTAHVDSSELRGLREEIDRHNVLILRTLENRGRLALKVVNIKRRNHMPTYDPEREEAMLKRLLALSEGVYRTAKLRSFFLDVFRLSVELMNEHRNVLMSTQGESQ